MARSDVSAVELTTVARQIYWSAPAESVDGGRRRLAFGLVLVLGCERLLREGRLRGRPARLAAAQAQAARLLAVAATGARWPTRRGDVLRRDGDRLARALAERATAGGSGPARLLAAHDLLDEIAEWLQAGALTGPAAPSAVDRLRVAQTLLREHRLGEAADELPAHEPARPALVVPAAWLDED
jgi:hypothetical protein